MKKTHAGKNVATPASRTSKRKAVDTTSVETPLEIDSGDERSEMGMGSQVKKMKLETGVRDEFKERYAQKDIGNRTVLLGKPMRGSFLKDSGALDLFDSIGISSFITELPKFCYPGLVKTFYGNLHVTDKGQFVSYVKGVKINLNPVMLSSMLGVSIQNVSVYSKRGPVVFEDFTDLDQLKVVLGVKDVGEFVLPSTSKVLPMAHLLFRICLVNICPRVGTKSNFSCQDLVVVAMLMAGRKFDLGDLVLNNMLEVVTGSASMGLPYGFLLTKIFEFFGVDNEGEEQIVAKDFLDAKGFQQSGLVLKDGILSQAELAPPVSPAVKRTATSSQSISEDEQRAFMAEVKASLVKLEKDSAAFRRDLGKIVTALGMKELTKDELVKISDAVQKVLEEAEVSATENADEVVGTKTIDAVKVVDTAKDDSP